MRLTYRTEGDRVYLKLDDRVENETRVWKMLQRFGVPVEKDTDSKSLIPPRFVPLAALPKLQRAATMYRWRLVSADGSAPVPAGSPVARAYADARPFDVRELVDAALRDPDGGEAAIREARVRLEAWARENEAFRRHVDADLRSLTSALDKVREQQRTRTRTAEEDRAAALSEMLRGVAGSDVHRAHMALKQLDETARELQDEADAEADADVTLPEAIPGFHGKLRHYQREGVEFVLRRRFNGVLADDMGLGKTIMTLASLVAGDERALVVGPANVLYNWVDETERFTGEPPLVYHHRAFMGDPAARVLVTTYDSLRSLDPDHPQVKGRPVLVLDEAHYIRNPETQRSRVVRALPQKRRLLLTGTPLVNGIEDYYELLREVGVTPWGSRKAFRDAWVVDTRLFDQYAQVRNATAALLHQVTRHVLLRRRKSEVFEELPPRTIRVVRHELPAADQRAYRGLEDRAREMLLDRPSDVAVFAALHSLRHHLAVARVPAVLERIRELRQAEESVVVYSQYLEPLRLLLKELGGDARLLEGATPSRERQAFAKGLGRGEFGVLLAQMDAGGIGLNFTGAQDVLFVHLGWTPSGHAQAMDRVHRIGQDKPVLVEFFVTPDTIDERLARILLRKEADQNLVLADDADVLNRTELAKTLLEKREDEPEPLVDGRL